MQDFDMENQLAQQRYQQALAEQNKPLSSPQGKMVGNIYVRSNPMEALISGLRMKQAKDELGASRQELKDLQGKRQTALADALKTYGDKMQGAPAVASSTAPAQMPSFDEADAQSMQGISGYGATTGAQAARAPDAMGAYTGLMQAPDASLRAAGMKGMMEQQAKQAALAQQQQYMGILDKVKDPQAAIRAGVPESVVTGYFNAANAGRTKGVVAGDALVDPYTGAKISSIQRAPNMATDMLIPDGKGGFMPNQLLISTKQSIQAAGRSPAAQSPYFQPVQTAQGVMAFNARTGRVEPVIGANGQPVVGAAADPALQGQLAGAKTTGAKEAEGRIEAKGDSRKADMFLQQLTQAENILKQGPTQSGAGAVVDAAGRLVGASTPGAQRAGQLESLSGWLVANVPRMEGPQSNFDVQNYMTMAGKIGDRTVPVKERLAALDQVRELQKKYKTSADARMGNEVPPPMQPTGQDAAALQWARSNPSDPRSRAILQRLGQ